MLLFAGAVALATPEFALARPGGHGGGGGHGFGGGGGHFGGGFGGGHFGGGHFGGGFGGVHGGVNHGGHHHDGFDHDGFHHHRGFGYFPYGGYGYYPYDSYYPDYNYYPNYDSGYYDPYVDQPPADARPYAPVTPPSTDTAQVTVRVPPDAQVWFDDRLTKSTGAVREFETPPMNSGGQYSYQIKAAWKQDGRETTQTQRVQVTPGAHVTLSFPAPQKTEGQTVDAKK
jgi:uncharacterized protein (TIGR03000 family)